MKLSTYLLIGGVCASVLALALMLISGYASRPVNIYVTDRDTHLVPATETDTISTVDIQEEDSTPIAPLASDLAAAIPPHTDTIPAPTTPSSSEGAARGTKSASSSPSSAEGKARGTNTADLTVTRTLQQPLRRHIVVAFSEQRPNYRFKIANFKGYAVRETSTVQTPTLVADEEWAKAVNMTMSANTLRVEVDIRRLTNAYGPYFRARNFCPVTILVPRGSLHGASVGTRTLYLDSIVADNFIASSADRITLNYCNITDLRCIGRRLNELKLDETTIRTAEINAISQRFLLTGTNNRSSISTIDIRSLSTGTLGDISVNGLSIGQLRWQPLAPDVRT